LGLFFHWSFHGYISFDYDRPYPIVGRIDVHLHLAIAIWVVISKKCWWPCERCFFDDE